MHSSSSMKNLLPPLAGRAIGTGTVSVLCFVRGDNLVSLEDQALIDFDLGLTQCLYNWLECFTVILCHSIISKLVMKHRFWSGICQKKDLLSWRMCLFVCLLSSFSSVYFAKKFQNSVLSFMNSYLHWSFSCCLFMVSLWKISVCWDIKSFYDIEFKRKRKRNLISKSIIELFMVSNIQISLTNIETPVWFKTKMAKS